MAKITYKKSRKRKITVTPPSVELYAGRTFHEQPNRNLPQSAPKFRSATTDDQARTQRKEAFRQHHFMGPAVPKDFTGATPVYKPVPENMLQELVEDFGKTPTDTTAVSMSDTIEEQYSEEEVTGFKDQYKNAYGEDASYQDYLNIDMEGDTESFGNITGHDLLLNKISQMGYSQQAAFKATLSGEIIRGGPGTDDLSMAVAIAEFEGVTGVRASDIAKRIKVDESVQVARSDKDLRTIYSMLRNIDADMVQGPGPKLIGHELTEKREEKSRMREAKAYETIDRLVEMTKGGIRGQEGEAAYTKQVRDQIYGAAIDSPVGPDSLAWVPLAGELRQFGAVLPNSGYSRMEFSEKFSHLLNRSEDGQPRYDELGRYIPNTMGLRPDLAAEMKANRLSGKESSPELKQYFFNKPSIRSTYMPHTRSENSQTDAANRILRNENWSSFEEDLIEARQVLSKLTRTTVDESRGNQQRLNAFGKPYDAQESRANAIDQAFRMDIGGEAFAGQPDLGVDIKLESELSTFLESVPEVVSDSGLGEAIETAITGEDVPNIVYADTDRGRYQEWVANSKPPEQGTDAWLAQRKGKVTASQASKLTGGLQTIGISEDLALEAMGRGDLIKETPKTPAMMRGNLLEEKAKDSFLTWFGREHDRAISWEEAYFKERKDLPGFGVSPDGMLFNEDGSSAGLLEIKVLGQKNLATALGTYNKQMQLQMAITKEKVTHFWAMDGDGSGDFVYETVYADSEIQKELISAGNLAHELKGQMTTIQDVEASRMARISSDQPMRGGNSNAEGQQVAFSVDTEGESVMSPWNPDAWKTGVSRTAGIMRESYAALTAKQRVARADRREEMKVEEEVLLNSQGRTSKRQDTRADKAEAEARRKVITELEGYAAANKRAKDSVKEFTATVKKTAQIAAEIGGVVLEGNESGMNEVRFAASTGMDVESVRGLREALEDGGLSTQASSSVMQAAATQTRVGQDYQAGSRAWADLKRFKGSSSLASVRNIDIGSIKNYREMNPQERVAWANEIAQGMPENERHIFLNKVGMGDMSVNTTATSRLREARADFAKQDILDVYTGATNTRQTVREGKELIGSTGGELVGAGAVTAEVASGILSSSTGGMLLNAAAGGMGASAVSNANNALTKFTGKLGMATKGLGALSAATAGWAVGSAIYKGLEGTDAQDWLIENVGGGINSLVGALGSEEAQNLSNIDRISKYGGRKALRDKRKASKVSLVVNIDPDLVVTSEADIDGKKHMNQHQSTKPTRRGPYR